MDDDFGFGTAIWATSSTDATTSQAVDRPHEPVFPSFNGTSKEQSLVVGTDPFEYSDDFNFASSSEHITNIDDDDFGEFGDFDEGDGTGALGTFVQDGAFEDTTLQDRPVASGSTTTDWFALQLDPFPSSSVLRENVEQTLHPLWERINMDVHLSDDDIRQVGGLSQVLVTPESRSLYSTLFQTSLPSAQPPNWIRSRIRRRHLVSLGIPVNLDEVLPHAGGKPLPALQITTRPMSAPPGPRLLNNSNGSSTRIDRVGSPPPKGGSASNSRAGTPVPGRSPLSRGNQASSSQVGLGPRPVLDEAPIERMLSLGPNDLTLLPLLTLESHLTSLRALTANASSVLTHLLQTRDALQQDSETYNGLIAELVGEAQKMKPGPKTRTGQSRRATGMT